MKSSLVLLIFICFCFLALLASHAMAADDDGTFNIDISDPNFDPKKAAAKLVDKINRDARAAPPPTDTSADSDTDDDLNDDDDDEGGEFPEEEGVLVLTQKNFDDAVDAHDLLLVEFYAPWCGHCKQLAPEYEKAAKELKEHVPPIALAKVDATKETKLAQRFSVSGYPTLRFFKERKDYEYDGPREAKGIVDFMKVRAESSWVPPVTAVLTLTQENFTKFINEKELALVEFYAPWCGHCKKLEPEYAKAADYLKENDPPIPLAKVDATVETELASQYGVSGYPTLKIFRRGKAFEYNGPREKHGIFDYMVKQVGDASSEVKAMKNLKKFLPEDDVAVVGFFESDKDKEYDPFIEAANSLREQFEFAHTFDAGVRNAYKVNAGSVVVVNAERFHSKHENRWHVFEKPDAKVDEIKQFIEDHQVPLVGHMTPGNSQKRYKKRPLCVFFYTVDFGHEYRTATQLWRHRIVDIAKDFRDVTFAIADEEDMRNGFTDFGFDDSAEEMNVGCYDSNEKKYPMDPMEEFDADDVREFIKHFRDGNLKPKVKSQLVPKSQKGPVTVVVGKSFEDIVNDDKKDVLIEFYAPWCGHCKKFEPLYAKMAKKLKKEANLVIAKMDATANDAPSDYAVSGFPTIYFAPSNNKKSPIKYEGNREIADIKKFMEEHATVSLGKGDKTKDEL